MQDTEATFSDKDAWAKAAGRVQETASKPGAVAVPGEAQLKTLKEAVATKLSRDPALSSPDDLSSLQDAMVNKAGESNSGQAQLEAVKDLAGMQVTDEISSINAEAQKKDTDVFQKSEISFFENDDEELMSREKPEMDDAPMEQGLPPAGYKMAADTKNKEAMQPIKMSDQGIVQKHDLELGVCGTANGGLAVAHAVDEEKPNEDNFVPSAVEFDVNPKPPKYRRRQCRLYVFLGIFILVAVGVGAGVGVTLSKDDGYTGPTMAPTSYRESLGIRAQVERVAGSEELQDDESPYSKALEWIIYEDPMQLEPDATNFMQRYLMAYFYFATTVDGPWRSCNPPQTGEDYYCVWHKRDTPATPRYYIELPRTRWLSGQNECAWAGVSCDDEKQVRAIEQGKSMSILPATVPFNYSCSLFPILQTVETCPVRSPPVSRTSPSCNRSAWLLEISEVLFHRNF